MPDPNAAADAVVLERHFDAPIDLIWALWTEPARVAAWYGPAGSSIPAATMDVRAGGRRLVCMEVDTPAGRRRMWFAGEYREVDPPRRLVYTEAMSDEEGTIDASGIVTEVRVELDDVDGRTRLVLTHVGVPADSPGAAGWAMALDKLGAHVEGRTVAG